MSVDHKTVMFTLQAIADKYQARGHAHSAEGRNSLAHWEMRAARKTRDAIVAIKSVLSYEASAATVATDAKKPRAMSAAQRNYITGK
jgi:hypothetical protein